MKQTRIGHGKGGQLSDLELMEVVPSHITPLIVTSWDLWSILKSEDAGKGLREDNVGE